MSLIHQIVLLAFVVGLSVANIASEENGYDANFTKSFMMKRAVPIPNDGFTYLNIGVLMASHLGA